MVAWWRVGSVQQRLHHRTSPRRAASPRYAALWLTGAHGELGFVAGVEFGLGAGEADTVSAGGALVGVAVEVRQFHQDQPVMPVNRAMAMAVSPIGPSWSTPVASQRCSVPAVSTIG